MESFLNSLPMRIKLYFFQTDMVFQDCLVATLEIHEENNASKKPEQIEFIIDNCDRCDESGVDLETASRRAQFW